MSEETWEDFLQTEFAKPYFKTLSGFLHDEYAHYAIHPSKPNVFNAFKTPDLKDLKVVILGQDPYHQPNQACGFSFSVLPNTPLPPSLRNIFQELEDDLGIVNTSGYLLPWAKQGVMLLNTVLTVRENQPLSHRNHGWETFTDNAIKKINELDQPIVFLLWGSNAKKKQEFLTNPQHLILTAAHPSPLSAYNGFFGCEHFSKTNEYLTQHDLTPIDWRTDNV